MRRLALGAALLGTVALAGGGQRTATTVLLDGASCQPHIGRVVFGVTPDSVASREMARIVTEDQAARQPGVGAINWAKVAAQDEARRVQTLTLLRAGRLSTGADFWAAALVFQHGNCPQHYQLANLLSAQGDDRARWLYAATHDRWQRSLGQPQKYGTQYVSVGKDCQFKLEPYDPATTDRERARYDVPPIAKALAQTDEINAQCQKNQAP